MHALFAYLQIDERYRKNYHEQYKRCRARPALVVAFYSVVYKADHGVEPAGIVGRAHGFAEYADYTGVFLEPAYKAGYDDIRQHWRKQRHGYPCEYPCS